MCKKTYTNCVTIFSFSWFHKCLTFCWNCSHVSNHGLLQENVDCLSRQNVMLKQRHTVTNPRAIQTANLSRNLRELSRYFVLWLSEILLYWTFRGKNTSSQNRISQRDARKLSVVFTGNQYIGIFKLGFNNWVI